MVQGHRLLKMAIGPDEIQTMINSILDKQKQ